MKASQEYTGIEELKHLEDGLPSWFNAKSNEVSRLIDGKHILDLGCGIGTFTRVFVENGFEVIGVDTSQDCLDRASGIKAKFIKEDICNPCTLNKFRGYFDSVVALDVLEHIPDDTAAVKNIRNLLKDNGSFILTVPAYPFLYSAHDAKIGHMRRYTHAGIKKLLVDNGFRIEKIFYWNFPGVFGWGVCKILKKNPAKASGKNVDRIYGMWLGIEKKLRIPAGLTIFVKAKKIRIGSSDICVQSIRGYS